MTQVSRRGILGVFAAGVAVVAIPESLEFVDEVVGGSLEESSSSLLINGDQWQGYMDTLVYDHEARHVGVLAKALRDDCDTHIFSFMESNAPATPIVIRKREGTKWLMS